MFSFFAIHLSFSNNLLLVLGRTRKKSNPNFSNLAMSNSSELELCHFTNSRTRSISNFAKSNTLEHELCHFTKSRTRSNSNFTKVEPNPNGFEFVPSVGTNPNFSNLAKSNSFELELYHFTKSRTRSNSNFRKVEPNPNGFEFVPTLCANNHVTGGVRLKLVKLDLRLVGYAQKAVVSIYYSIYVYTDKVNARHVQSHCACKKLNMVSTSTL